MSTDLDSRLRDYGTDIDSAIDAPTASPGRATPTRSRWVRYIVPAAAAAIVAVAAGVLVATRSDDSGPASVSESTVAPRDDRDVTLHGPGDWTTHEPDEFAPVSLAEGVFTWWVLSDDHYAVDAQLPTSPAACIDWHADGDDVTCSALRDTPLAPSAMYSSSGTTLSLFTNRSGTRVDGYAQMILGDVIGIEAEQVEINDADGWLVLAGESPNEMVLAWDPTDGPVAAIATSGLERDEVVGLAETVEQADVTDLLPHMLVLDDLEDPFDDPFADVKGDTLLGAIVDGQVCALPADHEPSDMQDPCITLADDPMVLIMNGRFGLAGYFGGLVGADVDRVRVDFVDGSSLSIVPEPQPIGDVQAFLASVGVAAPVSISALSESGETLMTIDLSTPLDPSVPVTEAAETTVG